MEQEREDAMGEVLYEIRHHASRVRSPDSPQEQLSEGSKGGLLSYLSVPGVNQLREKWHEYKRPRKFKKRVSLVVSPDGEHVAVAAENRIIILRQDDDYMEPCGIFISNDRRTVFIDGAWLEPQGILGVIDDMSTLYFIKSNGEEIARRTCSQLKLSAPIVDLIVLDNLNTNSFLCGFCIFTADGLLYHVEAAQEPSVCSYLIPPSSDFSKQKRQSHHSFSCLDFHPDLSLVVLVGASSVPVNYGGHAGLYSLYLLHINTSSELELRFCSPHFDGLFSSSKGYTSPLASPKVAISPQGHYIATLDLMGSMNVFNLDSENYSLSLLSFAERQYAQGSDNLVLDRKNYLNDIVNFSWWADHILILAKKSGSITMYNVLRGMKVIEKNPVFRMPVIERVKHRQGYVFVLECTSSEGRLSMPQHVEYVDMQHSERITSVDDNQPDTGRLSWSLISFSGRSVSEMYTYLISTQRYREALEFANRHGLDNDEVFKKQWLCSDQGIHEINMFLSKIKNLTFVLSECVNKVGPTEDVVKYSVSYGLQVTDQYKFLDPDDGESSLIWDLRVFRLMLLQYKDRLETFVGINMGRFSVQEYSMFRIMSLNETAIRLAESGKIGALNLLFKRHPYSLSSSMLEIFSAIPETIPVQSYGQLLPGRSPPSTIVLRNGDWVECEKIVSFINKLPHRFEKGIDIRTENILKHFVGFTWPSAVELSDWYKNRARDIENMSGQLDNCLSLVECACRKGIAELQQFFEDISYLHQLIYSDGCDEDFSMTLVTWEQLSDYAKFRMMLKGVKTEMLVERLREKAIPFMQNRFCSKASESVNHMKGDQYTVHSEQKDSFLVRWLKEVAAENKLDICLAVIENACGDSPVGGLFKDESETIETTLHCIYLCTLTDHWNIMASILSKLPRRSLSEKAGDDFTQRHGTQGYGTPRFSYLKNKLSVSEWQSNPVSLHEGESVPQHSQGFDGELDTDIDMLENRIKLAEGHVEVGRMLAYYQVPKPMSFFLGASSDEKNVKQLLRLILSKFGRRQPGRSDNEWANMWRDMQCFQERAFPFLDTEYMLTEFCRGLLKAGKFSLARNYLKGTGTIALATEKAENLVIQAAREYFFSASSLACTEIWKAKECLSLFPNSKNVQAEADVIDALTIRLPNLGVTLLPMEFRQIRNPMEIINMVIANQTGAYVDVEELIEIAKLLGLRSEDDITAVEEAVAREAAVAGDMQLAFDLCLALAKKGHGPIWDLCAAIARGPHLDNMDTSSRKQLLGFALSHCDEESIGELLHAWKDVDIRNNYEQLMTSTGTCPPNFSVHGSSIMPLPVHSLQDIFDLRENSEPVCGDNNQVQFESIKEVLSKVGMNLSMENGVSWDSLLRENRKVLTFAALELPWLLQLTGEEEYGKNAILGAKAPFRKHYISIRMQALISILYWLAGNDIAPRDHLIASLAQSIMESPVTEEDDVLGCSFLLNLIDAFHGVEIIEEQVKKRECYQEIYSIMNIGMTYSSLNNSHKDCSSPDQRRKLLLSKFRQKHAPFCSDEMDQIDKVQSSFWREWKRKLEEQRRLADQARALEQIIPGIETARFLSGDIGYIKDAVFSFIDSVKMEKRHILKEAVKLADTYGLRRTEVLLRFFGCALVSDHWGNDDILAEISEFREDIVTCPQGVIDMICTVVYPEIDGHNKQRLSYIYSILSACYLRLRTEEPASMVHRDRGHKHILESFQFCKVIEQECRRVSFISGLNFKNIAGLDDLDFEHFNEEIYNNIHDSTVEALADMVRTLVAIYVNSQANGLISWQAVYKHHVLGILASLETEIEARFTSENPDELQAILREIELNYNVCKKYVRSLSGADISHIIGRYCMLCIPCNICGSIAYESEWKDCLIMLLNFWIKVADDFAIDASQEMPVCTDAKSMSGCLEVFKRLVMEGEISENQGWRTVHDYREHGLVDGLHTDISCFFRAMIFSGCRYKSIAQVYYEAGGETTTLLDLYTSLTDSALLDVSRGSDDHQYLHRLLSSLSRPEGDHTEDLKMIRSEVWGKLSALSDNIQLESHVRVYALELMQSVTGNNFRSLPVSLVSEIVPWVGWDESCGTKASVTTELADVPRSITSTIVALKSARLAAAISPDLRVTPEDLITPDSAVSCFLRICEAATSKANIDVLQTILHDWEELFPSSTEKEKADESHEELNTWSSDNWDEGWESLSDEPSSTEVNQDGVVSVRPLHKCWMEIIKRLVGLSETGVVIALLDQSLSKPGVLLDEVEAQCLVRLVSEVDCFTALKTLLLLPYEALQVQCLRVVEAKTRGGGFSRRVDDDYELLTLLLSSGALRVVGTDPAFAKLLSYFCYLMGHLARICQEDLLKCSRDGGRPRDGSILFGRVLLPCFVSELVKAGQFLLAGFIVSRWMHVPKSFGLLDVAESCLRKYLEGQIRQAQLNGGGGGESGLAEVDSFGSLVNTVHSLRGMMESLLQSALSVLPTSTS